MGRCKAWLPWSGQPMLRHVVDTLQSVVSDVVVVGAPDQVLPEVSARRLDDPTEGLGPLAGLAVGLAAVTGPLAFVTATDAPYLTASFIRAVLAVGEAAAPCVGGRIQVLSAVYPGAAAEQARALLASGRRRPLDLLETVGFQTLTEKELPDVRCVEGFNTPSQYLEAIRGQGQHGVKVEFLGRAQKQVRQVIREADPGTLQQVLNQATGDRSLIEEGKVHPAYAVSLDGREFVRDGAVPIGPGERVIVLDAAVGG
ncbi:molybdenum cofactor guanylyltransferase [Myxococcota bacterium]|nr:molybdenum cofactor guanylyltransferase [Myxococcota bacterium]